jgi:hypothetical protein
MPLETTWLIEGKVILAKLSGVATKHDVQVYVDTNNTLVTSEIAQSPIHTIVYALDIEKVSLKIGDIGTVLQFSPETAKLYGWTMVVSENRLIAFLTAITERLAGTQFKVVKTYEDALLTLKRLDPSIADMIDALPNEIDQA